MKIKLLASLISLLALCVVATAQEYHIRANGQYNLRAAPGLDERHVETVPAGAILHVIGKHNRWLKISRNGAELWMADWLGYSRVDSPAAPSIALPASDIDNCCFVDRRCSTDADWTAGYWAFQRQQCPAPTPPQHSQQPASTAPVRPMPANADNCCQFAWNCNTDNAWQNGYAAFQAGSCDLPGIPIEGSPRFVAMFNRVFNMLKAGARQWYDYVLNSGLSRIQMNPPGATGFDPNDFHYGQGFAETDIKDEFHYIAMAGILAHESCHAHQWSAGIFESRPPWLNERECVVVQLAVHERLDPQCRECAWYRDLIANIDNPEYWWW